MTRETRANLIFLGIFFALALPGVVILTRKSYHEGGRDPVMRAPVRGEFAYMDPTPPIGLPRVVPPSVGSYIAGIAHRVSTMQKGIEPVVVTGDEVPIMSDRLNLQLLGKGGHDGKYRVALFGWNNHYAPLPGQFEITADRAGHVVQGEMTEYEPQSVPMEIRSELQDFGYVVPPDSALWLIATFDEETPVASIRVDFHIDKLQLSDTITFAPKLATTASIGEPAAAH